jgi:hypothetical protein
MKLTFRLTAAGVVTLATIATGSYVLAQTTPAPQTTPAARTTSPAGAKVYFIEPKDGATVNGPVHVVMGLSGMGIAPAGINAPDTGHHHVLVDVDKIDPAAPIPMDDKHRHFGRGQTETMLDLPAGKHTLQLVLADRVHVPHDPPVMSQKITVTVTR